MRLRQCRCHRHRIGRGELTVLYSIRGIGPATRMRETPNRYAASRRDAEARRPTLQPATATDSRGVPAPTLLLISADKELASLVRKSVNEPWKIELCEDPAIGREVLSRPSVRMVIVDDGSVDEEARG